jgi:hypothetical protein
VTLAASLTLGASKLLKKTPEKVSCTHNNPETKLKLQAVSHNELAANHFQDKGI